MPCALAGTAATQSVAPAARAIASFFMMVLLLLGLLGGNESREDLFRIELDITGVDFADIGATIWRANLYLVPVSTEVPAVMEAVRIIGVGAEPISVAIMMAS